MESQSVSLGKYNESTFLSQDTRILHQKIPSSGRWSETSDFDLKAVSIFERSCWSCFQLIAENLDFKTVLSLRLLSKVFNYFVWSYNFCSINVAQLENTALAIKDNIQNDSINNISKCRITLEINTVEEIKQLEELLFDLRTNNFFDNSLIVEFLKSIVRLDLLVGREIEINESNAQFLTELFAIVDHPENYFFLPCLQCLSVGRISNAELKFPQKLNNLKSLEIGSIMNGSCVTLPKSLDKLTTLAIGAIGSGCSVNFPTFLDSLTWFTIEYLGSELCLPELPSLKKLSIANLSIDKNDDEEYGCLQLTNLNSLSNLEYLCIKKIEDYVPCDLFKYNFDNLRTLIIGNIGWRVTFILPESLDNLRVFSMENIKSDTELMLPDSMKNLESFSIRWIQNGATIEFPEILENFESLTIDEIEGPVNLDLPESLPKLTTLTINKMRAHAIRIPDSAINLKSIFINDIFQKSTFELPSLMPNLMNLTINEISSDSTYKLPDSMPNLQNLTINKISSDSTCKLPISDSLANFYIDSLYPETEFGLIKSHNNLQSVSFESVHNEAFCKLICSLTNLKSLSIGKLSCNLKLPDTIGKLTVFNIGNISKDVILELPSSLESLESLTIGPISEGAKIELPPVLSNLKYLNIENIDDRMLDRLRNLPRLTDIVFQEIYCKKSFQQSADCYYNVVFELPDSWVNLKSCTIYKIACKERISHVDLVLPRTLKNLTKLTIQSIDKQATLRIRPSTDSFENLATLIIGNINDKAELIISDALAQLTTVRVGSIEASASISLPETLDLLQILSINFYGSQKKLIKRFEKFPKTLPNLSQLIIDRSDINLKLPSLVNGRKMFTFENKNNETIDFINEINQRLTIFDL